MMMMVISGGDNSCNGDSGGHGLPMMIMYITGTSSLCLLYTSPSPRDQRGSRMPSSA